MRPTSIRSRLGRLARRLRWRRRVPAGPRRGPLDGGGRNDDGGAGVREPRRPRSGPPAAGASVEPQRDEYLDLSRD